MGAMMQKIPSESWVLIPPSSDYLPSFDSLNKFYWNEPYKDLPHCIRMDCDRYRVTFPDGKIWEGLIHAGHYYFIDLINIAVKAAWLMGCSSDSIERVLGGYFPEPMRTETWCMGTGEMIISEPYCGDPQSVDIALGQLERSHPEGKNYFLFTGIRGGGDYERVGDAISKSRSDRVFLVGEKPYAPLTAKVKELSPHIEITVSPTLDAALAIIKENIKTQDTLLVKGESKIPLDYLTRTFQGSINTNQCFINLAAIVSNLKALRGKLGSDTRLMPIVKAFAYGTNNVLISKFLASHGIDILGVSYVDEGVSLKKTGITQSIFTINAALFEVKKAVSWGLEIGVSDLSLIEALSLEAESQKRVVKVHLHVDTGMSRLGCRVDEACILAESIARSPFLKLEGVMTHFACAESENEDSFTELQIASFDRAIKEIESKGILIPWKHAANSGAVLRLHLPQYNMARVGLALYGLAPSEAAKKSLNLKLALSLQSRIVGINLCKKGETVSYGRNYTVTKDTQRIAVVPVGYFDGLHRHYSGKGVVMIREKRAHMVGNICMDYLMVDISEIPQAAIGDPVLIFGEDEYGNYLPPEELASDGGSIVHELITCLGPRIQRIFVHEENARSC
jgi:alanine racemase/UDP-N-acetylmuramoyl-tripeptide--D-alanyl-D-alanine ligase